VEEFGLKSFGVGILWLRYPQSFTLTIMERHDIRRGCQTFARFHGGDEMWSVGKDQTARNIASAEMNYERSIVSNDERANTNRMDGALERAVEDIDGLYSAIP